MCYNRASGEKKYIVPKILWFEICLLYCFSFNVCTRKKTSTSYNRSTESVSNTVKKSPCDIVGEDFAQFGDLS